MAPRTGKCGWQRSWAWNLAFTRAADPEKTRVESRKGLRPLFFFPLSTIFLPSTPSPISVTARLLSSLVPLIPHKGSGALPPNLPSCIFEPRLIGASSRRTLLQVVRPAPCTPSLTRSVKKRRTVGEAELKAPNDGEGDKNHG